MGGWGGGRCLLDVHFFISCTFSFVFIIFPTDEGSSRSDSPFIDVEKVSSDEETEKQDGNEDSVFACVLSFYPSNVDSIFNRM